MQEQHSEEVNLSALKDLGKLVLRKIIWNSDYPAVKSIRSIGTRIGSTASYPLDLLLPEMKTHFDISFSKRKKKLKISKSSDNLELGIIFEKDSGEQRYSFFLSLPF
ncbi:hypothetical protein D6829_00350 [Candidatus Pacearchaeota archaeon]|nr:MAG: hypothetical protein D6829_00350 [Candidatus Pacearchaeota archaeon]